MNTSETQVEREVDRLEQAASSSAPEAQVKAEDMRERRRNGGDRRARSESGDPRESSARRESGDPRNSRDLRESRDRSDRSDRSDQSDSSGSSDSSDQSDSSDSSDSSGSSESVDPSSSGLIKPRAVLEWFGVDLTGSGLALDPTRACLDAGCSRRAMVGELVCPVHLGLVTADEMPDHRAFAAKRGQRLVRSLILAALLAFGGAALGVAVGDLRFGWLGGIAAAAVVAARAARELHFDRFASLLGMVAFFVATVLFFSGILVITIATLPLFLGRLLGGS